MPSSTSSATGPLARPLTEKGLIYSTAMTFKEYLAQSPPYAGLLPVRCQEIRLDAADQAFFATYPNFTHLLILIEEESPDTVAVLPVFQHMVECAPRLDMRILCVGDDFEALAKMLGPLLEDEDVLAELADADFPLVLVLDEEWNYQDQWGPHPDEAEAMIEEWMANHPEYEALADDESGELSAEADETYGQLLDQLTYEMRVWYNSSLNRACAHSFRSLLESLVEDEDDDVEDDDAEDMDDGEE